MSNLYQSRINNKYYLFVTILLLSSGIQSLQSESKTPIIQPGAPGEPSKYLDEKTAIDLASTSYTEDDLDFMQNMIVHHDQAVLLSDLVPERTNNQSIVDLAGRISVSQADEIKFMKNWLLDKSNDSEIVSLSHPSSKLDHAHQSDHSSHSMDGMEGMGEMTGMATPSQINELTTLNGTNFDRLFLMLMITHHDGAVKMVTDLRNQSGSAYDPVLNEFVSDVVNDQAVEIDRMNSLLVNLSDDPRSGLKAGLFDAETAISNLTLVTTLRKPLGFFDQDNPSGSSAVNNKDFDKNNENDEIDENKKITSIQEAADNARHPMMSFYNTDMAFRDNLLVTGSYHGFNMYEIEENGVPFLQSSIVCPGGQGDISIVDDILIMSVEETRGRLDCGLQGVQTDASDDRFRGLRIFDISDVKNPIQVGAVQTCRGSHTHSVVSGPTQDNKIIVYNSGTSSVRDDDELEGCVEGIPGDTQTALFSIDIIEIPIDNPSKSRIVSSPSIFADPATGVLGGLWRGGDHGDDTQETSRTDQCHDITVFPSMNIAAGACSGNGIIFDISDVLNPKRIDAVTDTGFAYWHSATFNNDGTKVLFTDEWGGGSRARCRAWDPLDWGADAIYDIVDNKLEFKSTYKMPAPQVETENCVAHNGSIIPVPGRDIFVQAWYQGGISIVDFTDSSNPFEIAYFDRGPVLEDELITGGYWSVYFYEGAIYATEITRGLDVFKLTPSEHLSENEILAATNAFPEEGPRRLFNPQHQEPMSWDLNSNIAKSYLDQLERGNSIDQSLVDGMNKLIDKANLDLNRYQTKKFIAELKEVVAVLEDTSTSNKADGHRILELLKYLNLVSVNADA